MKSIIDRFEPFTQEFAPKKLRKIILNMNTEQLKKLNRYLVGDEIENNPQNYQTKEDYLDNPIIYLSELCHDEPFSGSRFCIDFENIWNDRFDYTDQINMIINSK